tara:strand:- start:92 stop:304 length:213 start_codon:yes stop_codon:yes gene_type:complete
MSKLTSEMKAEIETIIEEHIMYQFVGSDFFREAVQRVQDSPEGFDFESADFESAVADIVKEVLKEIVNGR